MKLILQNSEFQSNQSITRIFPACYLDFAKIREISILENFREITLLIIDKPFV